MSRSNHLVALSAGALLALALVLGACASAPVRTATPGQAFTLQPGQRMALPDGATLRYLGVSADSRCPPDVQCIRAGDADVAFEFMPAGGAPTSVSLNTPEAPSALIGDWQLRLLELAFGEAPSATLRIDSNQ